MAGLTWRRNDADLLPVAFTYDRWENIAEIGFGLPGQVRELAYEYDAGGRRTGITLANGDRWEYQYDSYGQVVQGRKFDDGGVPYAPQQHRYLYDDIGNRKNVHSGAGARPLWYTGNALNQYVNWGSDSFIPIAGKASADAKVTVKATASGVSRTYEPVRDGEDFAIDIPVDVSRGAVVTDLEVNAVRFDEQQDVDLYRRLSGRYTVTPNAANVMAYDADGNLLAYDGWTLTWNGENRLVQIEKGSHRETYDYDYMGRRFVKKVYSKENDVWSLAGEEVFVYDGYKQIAAYAGASRTLARTYAWDAAGLDTPLWTTDPNGSCFYVADANKNIRMLFNESGAAVAEYDYDPFGQVTANGSYASVNPYRFSSEYHDDGTGLVYYNYRYYSPVLGRWTSRDPIGEEGGGVNLYAFVKNIPISSIDIFGWFNIQWQNRGWTTARKEYVQTCLATVKNRTIALKAQIANLLSVLPVHECYTDLRNRLQSLSNLMNCMEREIMGTRNLEITCCDLGTKVCATVWESPVPWYDDELKLNTNSACNFFSDAGESNVTLFHEVSHFGGTHDDINSDGWTCAHSVERLIDTDVADWVFYSYDKQKADRCYCGKK